MFKCSEWTREEQKQKMCQSEELCSGDHATVLVRDHATRRSLNVIIMQLHRSRQDVY